MCCPQCKSLWYRMLSVGRDVVSCSGLCNLILLRLCTRHKRWTRPAHNASPRCKARGTDIITFRGSCSPAPTIRGRSSLVDAAKSKEIYASPTNACRPKKLALHQHTFWHSANIAFTYDIFTRSFASHRIPLWQHISVSPNRQDTMHHAGYFFLWKNLLYLGQMHVKTKFVCDRKGYCHGYESVSEGFGFPV